MKPLEGKQGAERDSWDVFLSYRRSTAGPIATRVRDALVDVGLTVFIDEREIPADAEFPEAIADALLDARILVALLDADYFKSQWCLYELQVALAPLRRDPSTDASHVLPVLIGDDANQILPHLPPALSRTNLRGAEPDEILRRVQARLEVSRGPISERLEADDLAVRALRLGGAVPPAESLSQIPGFRTTMPRSLQERFRGRATDLWAIFHELATVPPLAAPRSCCVSGPPGMGKTQLVAEFAWRYGRRHFEGGIVWIDAVAEGDAVERQISGAVATLREAGGKDLAPDQVVRRAAAKGRVLWIVDGIRPPGGQAPQLLEQWCPFRGDVTLMCTSRGARPLDFDVSIDLGSLSVSAAVDLIAGVGVRRDRLHPEEWATIATWVGCVPQALQIQHAVLRSGFREPRDLLRAAQAEANPVGEIEAEFAELCSELPTGSISGIAETFDIWYENLSNDRELRNAAHLLARSLGSGVSGGLVARALLAKLAIRSWVQMVERTDGAEDSEPTWRMNDLVRSYLLARSPDPPLEVVRLARAYLGYVPGCRTVMEGLPRGGLDVLANVKSLSPLSLEEIARSVLERALSRPDDLDLAVVAELLGSLRDESARTRLAGVLKGGTEILWPLKLYLRYVQGFARPPVELRNVGGKLVLQAESLVHAPLTHEQSVTLMAPLLAVLREAPLSVAIMAAKWTAEIPDTSRVVESELLRQVKASPDRASMLAGAIVSSNIKSAVACAVTGLTGEWLDLEKRIDCLREALEIAPSLFIAQVWLARLLAESQRPPHGEEETTGEGAAMRVAAERPGQRLDIESLSIALPEDWVYEVTRAERRIGLKAHPRVAAGSPPINLVIISRTTADTSLDETVADYLRFMNGLAPLEDLSVRYVIRGRARSFLVSFLMSVENRRLRQVSRILRAGPEEVSATITYLETYRVESEDVEQILLSVELREGDCSVERTGGGPTSG